MAYSEEYDKLSDSIIQGSNKMNNLDYTYIPPVIAVLLFGFLFERGILPVLSQRIIPSYRGLSEKKKISWCDRITCMLCTAVIGVGCLYGVAYDSAISRDRVWGSTVLCSALITLTTGVLTLELAIEAMYQTGEGSLDIKLHHLAAIVATLNCLLTGSYQWFVNMKLLCEVSSPFLQIGWCLRQGGMSMSHPVYIINAFTFISTFFIFRIFLAPVVYVEYFSLMWTEQAYRVGVSWYITLFSSLALDILNFYWAYRIIKSLARGSIKGE